MIKLTVKINGIPFTVDRNLLPVDPTGRPYDVLIDEFDENGKYKIDTEYYNTEIKNKQLSELEIWYDKEIAEINKDFNKELIELIPILEKEARTIVYDDDVNDSYLLFQISGCELDELKSRANDFLEMVKTRRLIISKTLGEYYRRKKAIV